ncbi:MAG: CNNM domain-containing protein, partial [Erysipelotrichaceae bacterium]|nr:CNNM domain-containing protein [Erysipelotrichaceae bacterium]
MDNLAINIILYSIFFILSAFFSASEMAYTYVDQLRLKTGTKAKKALFVRAASLAENFTKTNVTIIFCNDVANIGSSAFLTLISFDLLGLSPELWMLILLPIHFFLLLIFAEYLPKAIARRYSYPLALAFAYPTTFFYYLFYIFIKPVELILNHKKMKTKEKVHFSEEQLHEMIDEIKEDGYMKKGEATLVKNAVEYVSTYAYEIMTPRVDIVGFDINDAVDLLKYDTEKLSFSRLIIYDQDLDHIVGFLPVKSFLRAVHSGVNFSLRDLIIEPLYVPRGLFISDLLHDFKKSKIHIAVVK